LPVEQLKAIIAQYQMQMITFGHKKNQNMGAYSYMLMNFDLVKWRLASLKLMQHQPREVIQEQNAMLMH
jgi:2-oxoglutarate dehydrogenase E1 component